MRSDDARPVALLFLSPEDCSTRMKLHAATSRKIESEHIRVTRGCGIHKAHTTDEVHKAVVELVMGAISEGSSIWIPNAESRWCRSNREALLVVLALGQILDITVHLGPEMDYPNQHPTLRRSYYTVPSLLRALETVRATVLDVAAESLIAGCIQECSTQLDPSIEALRPSFTIQIGLLRSLGVSDVDIVTFVNSIVQATDGSLIDLRHVKEADNDINGPYAFPSD